MARWSKNIEGYEDSTASIAIQRVSKEEKKAMAKKRSCRRTMDENIIHDKAVKMRKMTDEQLVQYVEDRVEKARSEGFNQGKAQAPKRLNVKVEDIAAEIGNIKGVGAAKMKYITAILEKYLGVSESA